MEEEVYGINLRPRGLAPLQGAQITAPSSSQVTSGLQSGLGAVGAVASAVPGLGAGIAAFSGLVGLFKSIDANKQAKRREREAKEAQKKAEERFDNYASNFNIPSVMGGTQAEIRARLRANPNTVFDPSMQFTNTGGNFAGGLQYTPGFDQDSFKVQYDPATGGFITTTTTPQGKTTATKHKGVSLKDLQDFNLNAGEIDKKLNMLNMMDGVLDVPWWESQPGFEEIAGEYQSTNPNSKYYDPNAEYTGPKPPSDLRNGANIE